MTRRRYPLMILINQSRNHRYPLINRLSTRRPWQSGRVTRVRGSIGRYYNNNRRSPDFEYFVIFSAIKQLVVSSLVSFWRLGPYLFNKHEKTIWWRLFFRDTEPWRHACFKRVVAYLEMILDIGNARVPKKPH